MTKVVTDATFEAETAKGLVLVDFWATWCGPCQALAPTIEELAKDFDGQALVGKVDVDNNQVSAGEYGIRSIPTVLIFKNGEVVDKLVGLNPKEVIAEKLSAHL